MRIFLSITCLLTTLIVLPIAARADYYVWRDVNTGLTLSFPDTWAIVSSADPDDILTIMPPSGRGNAECRVRGREDKRYMIYPPRYSDEIQKIDFSEDFWHRYLQEYTNVQIYNVQNTAGLGRGYAGYATAAYTSAVPGPDMPRESLMFASLYFGTVYILECSAHVDAFNDWKGLFLSIADSIDFRKTHHQLMTGHYRDFLGDPRIEFQGTEGNNYVVY
jgi:hypothetical protein